MKKFKINNLEIFANSLHDALNAYKHKAKDEVYYEDIDSSSEAKKYAKKFGLEVEGRRAPWGGYEFAFEGSPQDLKKLVQELKRIGIRPTWSSVGDSKVKDSKQKDANWNSHVDLSDYLHDVLDDENIDYVSIGIDFVTFDNIDDLEDAVFLLQRREGRKLKIDRKNLEVKILR